MLVRNVSWHSSFGKRETFDAGYEQIQLRNHDSAKGQGVDWHSRDDPESLSEVSAECRKVVESIIMTDGWCP
jgi:hypothetical protein